MDKLNLQNLPRKSALRRAIKALKGYVIVAGDLSQIEARILATLAGQDDLVAAFARGDDVYCLFASKLFGRKITKADETERFIGKTAILGLGYGLGYKKFWLTLRAAGIDVTQMEAKRYVDTYRRTYPRIPLFWSQMDGVIARMRAGWRGDIGPLKIMRESIVLPNGMRLLYPEIEETDTGWSYRYRSARVNLYGGKLTENVVQALARIVVSTAELYLAERGYPAQLQVHDELVYAIKESKAEAFAGVLHKVLTRKVPWLPNLPVDAEVGIGANYAEAK
jgi:DNA polymerase